MTKFYCIPVTANLDVGRPTTLSFLTVPAGQMWRTQYFAVERLTGLAPMTLTSHLTPAGTTGPDYLVNRLTFSGESFRRVAGGGVFGPGDKVTVAAEAAEPMTIKMVITIAIDEAVTVYPAPAAGPILSWIEPANVPKGAKPNFTLGGTGLTLIQAAIEVVIRRPNGVEQSRTGTFVNDTTITFSYDNITLVGQYDVRVKNATLTSNSVPFTAT